MLRSICVMFITLLVIQGVFSQQSNNEIKKIKKEINKLSKVKYKNLIEYKKEQQNMYKKLNSLEYAIQYKVDTIFKRLDQIDGGTITQSEKADLGEIEEKLKENTQEDIALLKEEIYLELKRIEEEKSSAISGEGVSSLLLIILSLLSISTIVVSILLYKKQIGINNHLIAFEKSQVHEVNQFEEGIQNEIKQISKTISNNRILAFRDSKDLSKQLRSDHDMLHDYIVHNNIDLMEMKSQLISLSIKSGDEEKKHKLAIELGNDLFFTKANIKRGDSHIKDLNRLEKEYKGWGYNLKTQFAEDFENQEEVIIEWKESARAKKKQLVKVMKPTIFFEDDIIQKGSLIVQKPKSK